MADLSSRLEADFATYRPMLFGIAYRMLGSASDAEDVVQESYLRYSLAHRGGIASPKHYLATITTRLCLDHLKSARVQRTGYIGPWLPEPVDTSAGELSPWERVELKESISIAFLALLERLTPRERAVFLLHEVFEYSYEEIAVMLEISVANCRQIAHRAKERLAAGRPRFKPSPETERRITERFFTACESGDVQALARMLSEEATVWTDGGGKVQAAPRPVHGRVKTAHFMVSLLRLAPPGFRAEFREINGEWAIVTWSGDTLHGVASLEVDGEMIEGVRIVVNPDKLTYLARQLAQ